MPASCRYGESVERPARVESPRTIAVVGPNPAMDRTEEIDGFREAEVNRARASRPRAGGKGFIVARALRRLNNPVTMYGFAGGAIGAYIRQECAELGIDDKHTSIEDDTRINTILVDSSTRRATVVNEPGPTVSQAEIQALMATVADDMSRLDLMILTGSLPPGVDHRLYGDLVSLASQSGVRTIVDAEGRALLNAVAASPWAIKCNLTEFRTVCPGIPHNVHGPDDRRSVLIAAQELAQSGTELVIVTLGAAGLIGATATTAFDITAAPVRTQNPTGSGDTFLAGFASAYSAQAPLESALRIGAAAAAANASVLVPDIGPNPQLEALLRRVGVRILTLDNPDTDSGHMIS